MFQEFRSRVCGVLVTAFAPQLYPLADLVDEEILFDAILHPLVVERELFASFAFLLRFGNRDKVRTDSTPVGNFIGDAVVAELEMPRRLKKRRIDDRLLDDNLRHWRPLPIS